MTARGMLRTTVFAATVAAGAAFAQSVNFDDAALGNAPDAWTATKTGTGDARWTVEAESTAPTPRNVLKQSGVATFPVCIKNDSALENGFVEVKFKAIAGREDQAGGVIWRCADADNYYIARANVLEDNVTIYRTVKGKRQSFKNVDAEVSPGAWHTLRVEFRGNHFTVIFDGKAVIEATDDTFTHRGNVGLWTKADSVTLFDDFNYGAETK